MAQRAVEQDSSVDCEPRPPRRWPAYRIAGVTSLIMSATGCIGLWLITTMRRFQGLSEHEFLKQPLGYFAVVSLSVCFIVGLFVMFPMAIVLQIRSGVQLPGPQLPYGVAGPVKATIVVVIGVVAALLVALLVTLLSG